MIWQTSRLTKQNRNYSTVVLTKPFVSRVFPHHPCMKYNDSWGDEKSTNMLKRSVHICKDVCTIRNETVNSKGIFGIIYKSVNVNNNNIRNCCLLYKGIKERFSSAKNYTGSKSRIVHNAAVSINWHIFHGFFVSCLRCKYINKIMGHVIVGNDIFVIFHQ